MIDSPKFNAEAPRFVFMLLSEIHVLRNQNYEIRYYYNAFFMVQSSGSRAKSPKHNHWVHVPVVQYILSH